MKKNYIIAIAFLVIAFGLTITAIVFNVLEEDAISTYFGMAASGAGFLSCLCGLNSWTEK